MNIWESPTISSRTLEQFVNNLESLRRILSDEEKSSIFFSRFPYEHFFNFCVEDGNNVLLCIKILEIFIEYNEFVGHEDRFNYALEFILINLARIRGDCKEILFLFELLFKLLSKNLSAIESTFKNVFDKDRILDLMLRMSNYKSVQYSKFKLFAKIVELILSSGFPDSANHQISNLFQIFNQYNSTEAQIIICKSILSLNKFWREEFFNVLKWLIDFIRFLPAENTDIVEGVIFCLVKLLQCYGDLIINDQNLQEKINLFLEDMHKNLLKVSSDLCLYLSHSSLKSDSFKLLKFSICKFLYKNFVTVLDNSVLNEVDNLPDDFSLWPQSDNDLFFCICHMTVEHSRMIWDPLEVLEAIKKCFYSRRCTIKSFVLKSIYYLYPVLIENVKVDFVNLVLGDDLLNYFARLCSVSYLYSHNKYQLRWILTRAPKSVKFLALTHWLNTDNNEEILLPTIQKCRAETLVLQLMLNTENLGGDVGLKCANILRQLNNSKISSVLALVLPLTVQKPMSFYNLLLAEPGVGLDPNNSVLICSLMGAVMSTINDSLILRGACTFTSKLLAKNKQNPQAITGFCQNVANIKYLINVTSQVDEETGIEIIRLLKVVVIIQKTNKLFLKDRVEDSFKAFFEGSPDKITRALNLLYHSLIFRKSLIFLDSNCILETYHMLLNYTLDASLQNRAYLCLTAFFQRHPWLTVTISTSIHMEIVCLSFTDLITETNILKMLKVWMELVRQQDFNGFCSIPETAIRSFIMRAHIKKRKKRYLFKLLEYLLKRVKFYRM